jgi:uncharacterized protein YpbB
MSSRTPPGDHAAGGGHTTPTFEQYAQQFTSKDLSAEQRLKLATEIFDKIEIVHTSEYGNFLKNFVPVSSDPGARIIIQILGEYIRSIDQDRTKFDIDHRS